VRRELVSWRAQDWASIKPGSIYNALKTLTQDGLVEVVGTDQVGGRPERTTYQLTTAGDQEFRTLLREEWWTLRSPIDPMLAAVSFLSYVTREEAIAALEHRIAQIHGFVRHLELAAGSVDGVDAPWHVREMHYLTSARAFAEVAWAQQLIKRLRNHEYTTADDPPWEPASGAEKARAPGKALPARRKTAADAAVAPTPGRKAAVARAKPAEPSPRLPRKPIVPKPRRKPAR